MSLDAPFTISVLAMVAPDVAIGARAPAQPVAGSSLLRTVAGVLEEALLLALAVFLFPLAILLVGTPIVLCVRFVVEMAHRL